MLFYIRCPTCSRILSYNLDKYHEELNTIRTDPNTNKKQKEKLASALITTFGYKKICCRIRILGLIPYHEIVIT